MLTSQRPTSPFIIEFNVIAVSVLKTKLHFWGYFYLKHVSFEQKIDLILYLAIQVCLDNSDTYNSESAITRTLFRQKYCARRLKCVSITRIPL